MVSESESLLCCWCWGAVLCPSIVIGDHCIGVGVGVGGVVVGDVSFSDEAGGVSDWVVVVFGVIAVCGEAIGVEMVDSSRYSLGIGAGSAHKESSLRPVRSVALDSSRYSLGIGAGSAQRLLSPHLSSLDSFSSLEP